MTSFHKAAVTAGNDDDHNEEERERQTDRDIHTSIIHTYSQKASQPASQPARQTKMPSTVLNQFFFFLFEYFVVSFDCVKFSFVSMMSVVFFFLFSFVQHFSKAKE